MNRIVAITGTPGTGKSRLAKIIKKRCREAALIEINDIVKSQKLFSGRDGFGSMIVDMKRLNAAIRNRLRNERGRTVLLVGHLAPELSIRYDIAIVTRARLATLLARLKERRYPEGKIKENIISEALDYCGETIKSRCREFYEVEDAAEIKKVSNYLVGLCKGKNPKKPGTVEVDSLGELYRLIKNGTLHA